MSYSLKSIKKEFADKGIFYTPEALAETLKSYIDISDYKEVYDPTCGGGNLLAVFSDNVKKFGQEINPPQAEECRKRLINCEIVTGDTLSQPAFLDRRFKVIVANPPFGIKWNPVQDERFSDVPVLPPAGKADYAFILHCLYLLDTDGVAVIMDSRGILFRNQREGTIRQWLIDNNYIDKIVFIPGKQFEDTPIETCLMILKKNRISTDVVIEDLETNLSITVTYEALKNKGYDLGYRQFFKQETKKDDRTLGEIHEEIQNSILKMLEAESKLAQILDNLTGDNSYDNLKSNITNLLNQ